MYRFIPSGMEGMKGYFFQNVFTKKQISQNSSFGIRFFRPNILKDGVFSGLICSFTEWQFCRTYATKTGITIFPVSSKETPCK